MPPEGGRSSGPKKMIVTSTETDIARELIVKEERIRRVSNGAYFDRDAREPKWETRPEPLDKKQEEMMSSLPRRSSAPRMSESAKERIAEKGVDIEAVKKRMGSMQLLQLGMGNLPRH